MTPAQFDAICAIARAKVTSRLQTAMDCPFCASSDVEVVTVEFEQRPALAVHCRECGAFGPPEHGDDPKHAIFGWNQRMGRMSLVK